jgi:hypothetical protein
MKYIVKPIENSDTKEWLLKKHYLKRMTSISFAFGLFDETKLIGVCTFGNAIPLNMKRSICGKDYESIVYELNRLCIDEDAIKNAASYFIGQCFKQLPKPLIIVSYADKSMGHHGYIYQATNFLFLGQSHVQMDWKVKGLEHLHSRTLMDQFAFESNRIDKLKQKYGDRMYQVMREPKNKYVFFLGSKTQTKQMKAQLIKKPLPYPKGKNQNYDATYKPIIQFKLL